MKASQKINNYFKTMDDDVKKTYDLARIARKKGYDPVDDVEVKLAKNLAERVVGLISVIAPQITDSTVVPRILELEKQWSMLDWRVALQIALEVAEQKHCKFENKLEAIEVGIRVGFAYVTLGVVSSPLEGFTSIDLKKRLDNKKEYFCMNFAGPIRNAGGTMAALSVIIADYVRAKLGYATYDPNEKEVLRCHAELTDYHSFITNLQYFPSEQECKFILQNLPIEIGGDASEKYEVSNGHLKDLPRIKENRLRSGYCLIHSSCIPLKAPKLWKQLQKWGEEMGLTHWNFLEEFVKLQKKIRAKGKSSSTSEKLAPDYTYIKDLVAGRPVFSHPLQSGGFRLRYGRSRTSGYSAMSIHPATMHILNEFLASATHVKVERPSKGAALTSCDTIEGPIVKLEDGTVLHVQTEEKAVEVKSKVKDILYIGDLLVSYGDFLDRAHPLVPAGYCQEFWIGEFEEKIQQQQNPENPQENENNPSTTKENTSPIDINKVSKHLQEQEDTIRNILLDPIRNIPSFTLAKKISKAYNIPLHPNHTYFYSQVSKQDLIKFLNTPFKEENEQIIYDEESTKKILEVLGVPHTISEETSTQITIEKQHAQILKETLQLQNKHTINEEEHKDAIEIINTISPFTIRDKAGVFIGARMGRPEKAKMRKLTGSPHGLFPVGEEGGRLRSFQSAITQGHIRADFCIYYCEECKKESVYSTCHICDKKTIRKKWDKEKGLLPFDTEEGRITYRRKLPIREYVNATLKRMKTSIMPDLIKGVRGTMNKEHHPENLMKAILRAKHDISVNKDGTTRFDASEVPLTHFKPKEIGASVEKLIKLGYTHDINNRPLESDDQILELFCQDIVIPSCPVSPDLGADKIVFQTTQFIDELLVKLYKMKPFYNAKTREDLIGHYVIGLAPHTSAGMIARIIGFSNTQGFLAHPFMHAAMRRDCDGDESCFFLVLDAFLNFSRKYLPDARGSTMDAPLVLTTNLDPAEIDDMAFNVDIPSRYSLEFYRATHEFKMPWDVKIPIVNDHLGKETQYEGMLFTHDTSDFNKGVLCSAYKTLPSMADKLGSQLNLAEKIRAVDQSDVARLVIEKHFIRDTKGNLRKFSLQQFRCVNCNAKYRRPPIIGRCTECSGKVIFTISEGSVVKYLDYSLDLAHKYNVDDYLKQTLELTKVRIESMFGKEKEKQTGLTEFFA